MDLKGKVAVLVGASGGIGTEIAKKLIGEGLRLVLVSNSEEKLQSLSNKLGSDNCKYYVCDLTEQTLTIKVAKKIADDYKTVDLLINAAGVGVYKQLEDITIEEWNNSLNINLTSVFIFSKELLKSLESADDSLILNLGSGAGVIPMSGRSAYCSSKFGLRGFTLSLDEEYKRVGKPKFTLITLGSTLTGFGPLGLEEKTKEMENGKSYFTPEWVGQKLIEIIKDENREVEYTLYPGDYGFEEWHKPEDK
jgi:short-subunit dehydrogenase